MIAMTFTACTGSDDPDENGIDPDNPNSFPEKAAVKYLWESHSSETGETIHYFVTFHRFVV